MLSLLAIVLSMAMLLAGSGQPVGKSLRIENITVERDGEVVKLAPVANVGFQTDGQTAVYDFFIERNGEKLLPLQLVADADKALLLSDSANTTLKLTREDLKNLAGTGEPSLDTIERTSGFIASTLSAYGEIFRLMNDPEAMKALQAEGDRIYDEVVDRGQGTPEKLLYQGVSMDSTSYEYDVTAAQFGGLIEQIEGLNEAFSRYSQSYFDMLASMPADSPLAGADSWRALYEKQNVKMHVVESVTQSGLFIRDCVLSMTLPGADKAISYDIYMLKDGEHRESSINTDFEMAGVFMSLSGDTTQDGSDQRGSMTVSVRAADGSRFEGEAPDDADAPEEDEEPEAGAFVDEEDGDIIPEGDGGNGGEELLYATVDFSFVPRELMNFEVNADLPDGVGYSFSIENSLGENGSDSALVTLGKVADEHDLTVRFDAKLTDGQVDIRATEDGAASMVENFPSALLPSLTADAMKLMGDEDVQQAMKWLRETAPSAPEAVEDLPGEPEEAPAEESDSVPVIYAGEDLDLASVHCTYLPEGFELTDTLVDEENDLVSLTLSDGAGVNIYVSLGESLTAQSYSDTSYFVIDPQGEVSPLSGTLVTCEDSGDYVMYNADDGLVSYSVFPDGDVPAEEIVKLLAGIRFE